MSISGRSRSFSGKRRRSAPQRPFDRAVLERARAIAQSYQVVLWFEEGEWYGRGVELPGTMNDGKTTEECIANVRESFITTVAVMLEEGITPPPAALEGLRNEQVNIRLSADERLRLATAARQRGFEGVSDFVRTAALDAAGR